MMSTFFGLRRPAARPAPRQRLRLEALEARCACSAGGAAPPAPRGHAPDPAPPPAAVGPAPEAPPAGPVFQDAAAAGARHLHMTAGVPFHGVVAHFDGDGDANDAGGAGPRYDAEIAWDDGRWTDGAVQPGAGGGIDIIGTATYAVPGQHPFTVQLIAPDGTLATAAGVMDVAPAADSFGAHVESGSGFRPPTPDPAPLGTPPSDGSAAQAPAHPEADATGLVPWVRLPDPRAGSPPDDPQRPPPAGRPAGSPWPDAARPHGAPPPADGPAEAAPEPPYLVDAGPAADDPPVVGDAFAPIDLRPAPVAGGPPPAGVGAPGAALAFWLPAPVAPAAPPPGGTNSPDGGAAGGPVADARPVACDGDPAPAGGDRADAGRRCGWLGLSWKGLSGGLALIFAERALAARCAERDTIKLRAESPSPSSPGSIGPDQGDGRRIRRRTP